MHWRDVAATGVLLPGSRVDYRYLLAGEEADLEAFHHWLQTRLEPGHRWLTLVDAEPRVARALERARGFLLLSGSLGDRKSTRLNSSHVAISYAGFCLKKKNIEGRL